MVNFVFGLADPEAYVTFLAVFGLWRRKLDKKVRLPDIARLADGGKAPTKAKKAGCGYG